ncbi:MULTISPECIES: BamA/TamA family outer membrane protein [unclassified Coleofasciculus]|uniref:BamA/TamA family outer membrane protein n=1 Tax=unclassified Coleofasciculus TaxID=2692782 RepID=UPI00187F134A|nr:MULTISPECIES: BamA/TamA family outer membrane protein [unclassified Coleofasciculus]MBE9125239.1 BamA/TamA family outer membrane protein [Coleofasciculus sp. LEGE 07081]MBE9148408.1 BamA/TamA family outer membrane protein [Coleofasciculus sp. LEGE 07092]
MVYKTIAISTLAALVGGELTNQAIASPDPATANPQSPARNYVVPTEASPAPQPTEAIAAPEAIQTPEFAQSTETAAALYASNPAANNPTPEFARATSTNNDLVVIATDVQVIGVPEELQQIVLKAIGTRPGTQTSQSQLNKDITAILNTGLFSDARVTRNANPNGWEVAYQVQPAMVRSLQLSGNQVLTPEVANTIFQSQFGKPVSPAALRQGVQQVSQWYKDNGYILAEVLDIQSTPDGAIILELAEGVVGDINLRFLDEEGNPTDGRTREDFIKRELKLQPGQVFKVDVVRQDLQQLYQSGLFDTVDIALNGDATDVGVTYELIERSARAVNAGAGYDKEQGVFGTLSFNDFNVGGVNQRLGVNLQFSRRDFQFDGNFGRPYLASNPDTPGYNINTFRRRTVSRTFDDDVDLANGDDPREGQFGGGVTLSKPLNEEWGGSVGLNYTRTSIRDSDGNITPVDELGNSLSFSGTGIDDLVTVSAGVARDKRDNPFNPTQGSLLRLTSEQSVPIGSGSILMNQVKADYSQYLPLDVIGGNGQEVLAFNVQGGTTIGDLPPYRAFNLGGQNSVRGYGTGDVGTGRSYVLASAEYRIPLFNPVGAVVFADFASDLGTGDTVPGEPGVVRDKPGAGFGYGAGLRVNSPVGIIRADLGFNDQGESRVQFGLGQRF